jgi:hypothetical protein
VTEIALDAVVEANRKLLLKRSQFGIDKYGVTLAGSGLTRRQLLQHALEEALDMANYIQAEIMRHDAEEAGLLVSDAVPLCRICGKKPRRSGFDHCCGTDCIPF